MEIENLKVLIVEDESIVALDIESALIKIGVNVAATAYNYDNAIESFNKHSPDLVIMDINLGDSSLDGIITAIDINKIKKTPIIFLTAFNDDRIISKAVALDPIGYLNKPFKRDDLKSLIHLASFKINKIAKSKQLTALGEGYFYEPNKQNLYFHDKKIKLNNNETQLLKILFEANGDVVTFETLEYQIWNEKTVSSSALRTVIYRLRSKLEHNLIDTIQSVGCKLNVENEI